MAFGLVELDHGQCTVRGTREAFRDFHELDAGNRSANVRSCDRTDDAVARSRSRD